MQTPILPYKALALQTTCYAVNNCTNNAEAATKMQANIQRIHTQIKASKQFIGPDLQLVVLPEYFMTGFPMSESLEAWQQKACIHQDGAEYTALSHVAKDCAIYLSGNAYEIDPAFPDLYFQVSFIINPSGEVILRYRRLNSMFAPTPHDVLDAFIAAYGQDALFPVVQTPIGNLACIASEEILYPEIARALALKGAEIMLHSSSEVSSYLPTQKNIAKLARAQENMAYVVSANSAGIADIAIPFASTDGHSQIVQYEGMKIAEAANGESMNANATIHIEALRHHRKRPGMGNFLSRQRLELFTATYQQSIYPANSLTGKKADKKDFVLRQQAVIQSLIDKGIIQ